MFWKPENLGMNRGPPDRAEQAGTQLGVWKAEGTKRLRNWWHQVPLEVGGGAGGLFETRAVILPPLLAWLGNYLFPSPTENLRFIFKRGLSLFIQAAIAKYPA